jgi:two-component sensor histidine kinase
VTLALFEESRNRIRSMALVHEKLYGTKDLSSVDMSWYIHSLATQLLRSYGMTGQGIELQIDAEGVPLMIDAAIPCGLMLNELISNALKHAFPNGRRGRVRIALHREAPEFIVRVIEDDGVGIPQAGDVTKTESLGLRVVGALADQLQATIELDRSQGARFTIRFQPVSSVRTGSLAPAMNGSSYR